MNNSLPPLQKKIQSIFKKGLQLHSSGDLEAAEDLFHQLLNLDPLHTGALHLLGTIRMGKGHYGTAFNLLTRAINTASSPQAQIFLSHGIVLERLNRNEEALTAYRKAIELKEDLWSAWLHCIKLNINIGRLSKALQMTEAILAKNKEAYVFMTLLGDILMQLGQHDDAEKAFRKALKIKPNYPLAMQNLLLNSHYIPGITLRRIADYHREFSDSVRAAIPAAAKADFKRSREPDRPLRIGFVSADFRRHPIGYFMAPFLPHLDKQNIQTICYSDNPSNDDMTMHVRSEVHQWFETRSLTHEALAEKIGQDEIDILFDLSGHAGTSRLLAFARKPSPIQVTWAGYVGTTGLEEMDYIVADKFHVSKGEEKHYVEKILRIADCQFVVRPPDFAPEITELPTHVNGFITFGTFNIPTKINPEIVSVWCRIMEQIPKSRILLKYRGMDDPANKDRIQKIFRNGGIEPSRVMLLGATPHVNHLNHYNMVDIALDPAPYSGGLTTCEALWMGTPVVTCPGKTFASRHSHSILSCIGLTETIAEDFDHYVDIAVQLALNSPRLTELSAGLREQVANSPLFDGPAFAKKFTVAVRKIWKNWCKEK